MSVLELRGVSKTYGQEPAAVHALAGVDLSVRAGEMVAVMGPSGSGKSTLLTIAGSLEEPTSGDVLVCGMALAGMSRGRRARLRRRVIGYVFQDYNLLPELTAAENVALPLELDGVAVPKARAAGMAALEALGVADRAARFPDQLSGGERQRVAIARAFVGGPPPTAGRRAVRCAGLGARGRGDAAAARGLPAGRRRSGRDPRRAAGRMGRPGCSPARRAGGRPDQPAARPRVPPHAWGDPVSVALRESADLSADTGGLVARRAVARLGWRLFRREWRQQLLVFGLLTVAVAAMVTGSAVAAAAPGQPGEATFGTATAMITLPGSDPRLAADIAAIKRRHGAVNVIENENLSTGTTQNVQLRAEDPRAPFGSPMLTLVSGRYPAAPGEVALTGAVANLYGVSRGGLIRLAGRSYRVTGIVQNPSNLLAEFALVEPGQVTEPNQVSILLDARRGSIAGLPSAASVSYPGAGSSGISPAGIALAASVLGLVFIGLVAVAGFTVLAQRRLRVLGMLSCLDR
ncbi:MAG: ATP-binding cassette domain-containing protein [Streptosporangiaceae bacterium]